MTSIMKSNLLKFNTDTVNDVRKEYNWHTPGSMNQSIEILHDWIQKQEKFTKKDFDKEYLERFIISAKGSVEKAKRRFSKLCTMRTMAPTRNLFKNCRVKDLPNLRDFLIFESLRIITRSRDESINLNTKHFIQVAYNFNTKKNTSFEFKKSLSVFKLQVMMPELTADNCRLLCSKMYPTKITSAAYMEAYQHCVIICEYMKLHDYAKGYSLIIDLNDVNITDVVTNLNFIDFRNILTLIIEGYGIRIKGIHILSSSTVINTLVKIVKQIVSTKISQRINVFRSVESLHTIFPKHLLPQDFGGEQKSILELFDELNEELSSESHLLHMMKMKQACTDEKLRRSDKFNEEYLGMPGSFKMLNID